MSDWNSAAVQKLLRDTNISKAYPESCLPSKCTAPTTIKAKNSSFESISFDSYCHDAHMVSFRTNRERIPLWLRILSVYYYDIMGEDPNKTIVWVDHPSTISSTQPLQKITIDVSDSTKGTLEYKLTFFIKTALIQVQGSLYEKFATDFKHLMSLASVVESDANIDKPDDTRTSANAETSISPVLPDKGITPIEDFDTPHKEDDNFDVDTTPTEDFDTQPKEVGNDIPIQNLGHQSSPSDTVCEIPDEVSTQHPKTLVQSTDNLFARFESVVVDTLIKVERGNALNTEQILQAISYLKTSESASIATPKLKSLQEKNEKLEAELRAERYTKALMESQLKDALHHERELLTDTRKQLKTVASASQTEVEFISKQLQGKNEEIATLNLAVESLTKKLNLTQDELLNLKTQLSLDKPVLPTLTTKQSENELVPQGKPCVLLIGTSNTKGINESKITSAATVLKIIKYTIKDAKAYILQSTDIPSAVILHCLTNDLTTKSPQEVTEEMLDLVQSLRTVWPHITCIISLTTPRVDTSENSVNAQIINVLIKQKLGDLDNVGFMEHINMLSNGNPNTNLLRDDGVHLNDNGISMLASNFKKAIHGVLDIPLPRRDRSRSRHRFGRGRGRGIHN